MIPEIVLIIALPAFLAYSVYMYAKHGSRNSCKYGNVKSGSSIKVYKNDRK